MTNNWAGPEVWRLVHEQGKSMKATGKALGLSRSQVADLLASEHSRREVEDYSRITRLSLIPQKRNSA